MRKIKQVPPMMAVPLSLVFKVFVLVQVVWCANLTGRVDPLVLTSQGLVRGVKSSEGDFSSFLGIPYAQIDSSNPFGDSLPAPTFEDVYNAYDGSVACLQTNIDNVDDFERGTLDCLRLNIYVPDQANSYNPLPVMVWIHGGVFAQGKAGDYGPWNLVKHGIVLVTINYRLGPYGFMCLDSPSIPANQGLRDQLAALRWVKENIAAFGGNPNKVTLAGESAGSGSVNLHLYSQHEKLFHKAILQSGIIYTQFVKGDELGAIKLAQHLGFATENTEAAIEFLTNTPPELVIAANEELEINFSPCIDQLPDPDSFVTTNPYWATFPRKTRNVPILIGYNSKERYGLIPIKRISSFKDIVAEHFDLNEEEQEKVTRLIEHYYAGDVLDTSTSNIISYLEFFESDLSDFYATERELTKMYEQGLGPIYQYVYEYVSENDVGDRSTNSAPHMAELKYLFSKGDFNKEEQEVADRISELWANFVKEGNPTPTTNDLVPVTWPPVTADRRPFFAIGTNPRVENRFRHESISFWELFIEKYEDKLSLLTF